MLAKKNRLLSERDFSKLFAKGKPFGGRGLGIKMSANTLGHPRIGFVVSAKVAKHAVDRNRLKRRLREILRPIMAEIGGRGVDLAFMARSEAMKMTFDELQTAVRQLLDKSGLTKVKSS